MAVSRKELYVTYFIKMMIILHFFSEIKVFLFLKNVDGAMHFIYSHKYNTNSAEDSSDMNWILFRA